MNFINMIQQNIKHYIKHYTQFWGTGIVYLLTNIVFEMIHILALCKE